MSRINGRFAALAAQGRRALIPYITAGDPSSAATVPLMHALAAGGADVIELGVPFSDPMADGPTIQLACERALEAGMSLRGALECVREFRRDDDSTPVVLMGYLNPIEAMGAEAFAEAAVQAGVDGVLTVDLTAEEADTLAPALRAHDLDVIFLVAPTTGEDRIRALSGVASGYLYYVSLKGVTGSGSLDLESVSTRLDAIRGCCELPIAVGFGIRTAQTAAAVAQVADGVVIGSALIELIADSGDIDAAVERLRSEMQRLREAVDATGGEVHAA